MNKVIVSLSLVIFMSIGCGEGAEDAAPEMAPTSAAVPAPAPKACEWHKVSSPDYERGTGTRVGLARAYPMVRTKRTISAYEHTHDLAIDITADGCGDILIHEIEIGVTFKTNADRNLTGPNRAILLSDQIWSTVVASNLTIVPNSDNSVFTWVDGIHRRSFPEYNGKMETVAVDAGKTLRLYFTLPLPAGVDMETVTSRVSRIYWTDAATGQRFDTL